MSATTACMPRYDQLVAKWLAEIEHMPAVTPENTRYRGAKFVFGFLVGREAWEGCADWDALPPLVKAAFVDALAYLEARECAPAKR